MRSQPRPRSARLYLLGALLWLAACQPPPPEQALRENIGRLQAGLEERRASVLEEYLAEDFIGPDGLDRQGIKRLAVGLYLRHRDVGITVVGPLDVQLQGRHARVRLTAALSGGGRTPLPSSARLYSVETAWRLDDGQWRLISAQWEPRL